MADNRRKGKKARGRPVAPVPPTVRSVPIVPVINGWTLLPHHLLLGQLANLVAAATKERAVAGAPPGPNTKLLANVNAIMFDEVPTAPGDPMYRHGGAIAGGHREWYRAKTGNGRFRLFYRFDSRTMIIIYAWLNDDDTLRTYGSRTDAYAVFARMLDDGNPPGTWDELLAAARVDATTPLARALFTPPPAFPPPKPPT